MRRFLDGLYRASGWLAALMLVAMVVVIMAQVLGRLVGVVVPSATQMSGFLMAVAVFLALAYTLAAGEHIRVTIVAEHVGKRARWWLELWSLAVGTCLIAYYAVFSTQLAWESFVLGDRADGLLPIPYVLPQGAMAAGVAILLVRLIDEIVDLVRTGRPKRLRALDTPPSAETAAAVRLADPPARRLKK